jgi:hypothetical protein
LGLRLSSHHGRPPPTCPLLFLIYGTGKPLIYHGREFVPKILIFGTTAVFGVGYPMPNIVLMQCDGQLTAIKRLT